MVMMVGVEMRGRSGRYCRRDTQFWKLIDRFKVGRGGEDAYEDDYTMENKSRRLVSYKSWGRETEEEFSLSF